MGAPEETVGIVGLGYVGLPLAVAFGRRFRTELPVADALILAVAHDKLLGMPILRKVAKGGCVVDVKAKLDPAAVREAGLQLWRL